MVLIDSNILLAALKFITLGLSARSDTSTAGGIENSNSTTIDNDTNDVVSNSNPLSTNGEQHDDTSSPLGNSPATQTASSSLASPSPLMDSAYNGTWFANMTAFSDSSCIPPSYNAPTIPTIELPSPNPALATVYRYRQQQGVNLGSWFMLEGWMVPSLFTCAATPAVSEYDVATGWNGQAKQVLEKHWDTFIAESDFAWMASLGINTVRLPLGYWHIGTGEQEWITGTMYESVREHYVGAWPRVLRAVSWAEKHNIGVLIDLHGAPGSQNGQHHSGVSDGQTNLFSSPSNMQKTISVLQFLTKTFVTVPNIVGIQLLNEPINIPEVFDFYTNALNTLRGSEPAAQSFPFYLHDAFDLNKGADFIRSRGREWNVLDHHSYYVFTPYDNSESASAHSVDLSLAGSVGSALMATGMALNGNLIIGEWSCALSDESLRGEENPISSRRQFCEVQEKTYRDVGSGASFWSLTKEDCQQDPAWCFKSAVGNSLPTSFFSYEGLLVAKDLNSAIVNGVTAQDEPHPTSQVATGFNEGSSPPSNSPRIHPSTWAAVSALPSSVSLPSTSEGASETLLDASTALSSTPTPTALEVFTTLSPEASPSETVTGAAPASVQLISSTFLASTATPTTFQPLRRLVDSLYSKNETTEQLPPLPEILAHAGRPDADLPIGAIDTQRMNMAAQGEAGCCLDACTPDHTPIDNSPAGARRRWITREHRVIAIHKRRMANEFRGDFSTTESTSSIASKPTSTSIHSNGISVHDGIASHISPLPSTQFLKNGTLLHVNVTPQLTPAQQAIQRGFSDGFMTAKMFAQQGPGMSRLGFKWQYVEDSLAAHGSNVEAGKEGYYREWFDKGLTQGESMVAQVIARMNA